MTVRPHNIYIHVPFCIKKCNYCSFYSTACNTPDWDGYRNQILSEINYWSSRLSCSLDGWERRGLRAQRVSKSWVGGRKTLVPTVFFGGGTPSLMPTKIFAEIMTVLREKFDIAPDAEITIEANPGTIDAARLAEFIAAGVNRISIGVQSLNDEELKFLGRVHNAATARELIKMAKNVGLRTSADFIYGLPGQTVTDIKKMCHDINALELEHCSMYELSIESDTVFAQQNLEMPDNETMAQMYEAMSETLNLLRYEVSNYGTPCKHNSNIWDGEPYLGLGPSAAGRVLIDGQWYETLNSNIQLLSVKDRAVEMLITGLRTTRGIKLSPEVREIINHDIAGLTIKDNRLVAKSFLTLDNLIVRLLK